MRLLLTAFLLTICLSVVGQKRSLLGKYKYSFFMGTYYLTLSDSGKFKIEESSDSGLSITTGTWTIKNRLIQLVPSKGVWYPPSIDGEKEDASPSVGVVRRSERNSPTNDDTRSLVTRPRAASQHQPIRRGAPIDDFDLLIGATAVAHDLIMVTNNTDHFKRIKEIALEDWTN